MKWKYEKSTFDLETGWRLDDVGAEIQIPARLRVFTSLCPSDRVSAIGDVSLALKWTMSEGCRSPPTTDQFERRGFIIYRNIILLFKLLIT
jgi:hypothetical protein